MTSVIGKIDCLTVKAEAPVRPRFDTDFRCVLTSALEGRRCSRISWGVGSSRFPNILSFYVHARPEQELKRSKGPYSGQSLSREGFREKSLKVGMNRFSKGCSADG